jgi:stage II sporulation protein D
MPERCLPRHRPRPRWLSNAGGRQATLRTVTLQVAILAMILVAPAPWAGPALVLAAERSAPPNLAPTADLSSTAITFYGRGYGHGVGMSQYGARGRALAGQTAASILAHYFAGTAPGSTDPTRRVRVLVLSGFVPTSSNPLRLYGRRTSWSIDGVGGPFPADGSVRVMPSSTGLRIVVRNSIGTVLLDRTTGTSFRVRPAMSSGRIQVWSKPSAYDTYRGVIRVMRTTTGLQAINEVGLDLYLRGVVPAEMPYSWPTEALKAQAVVARSYAVRRLHPTTGTFDLYDDARSQVYRGSLAERSTTTAAIGATAGGLVMSGTTVANTLFHSTGGGATENNENVFTSSSGAIVATPVSYLRGSADRSADGTSYDAGAPHATWQTASYSPDALSAVFGADSRTSVGPLTALDLSNRGVSGRLISVTLTGSLGIKTVSGDVFRSVFNAHTPSVDPYMWSTLVDIAPIP